MKNIMIMSCLLGILAITSCSKFLDVQPKQTFGDNLAVSDVQGLGNTVIGAYSKLQSGNLYGGGIIANSEFMADYISTDPISDFGLAQFRDHSFNTYNPQAVGMWNDGYNAILIVNTVLKYLPNFEHSKDSATVRILRANCQFIRGIMLYELVKMFAQPSGYTSDDSHPGIPIVLSPGSVDKEQSNPRATVAQVYAQVIADLKAAEPVLTTTLTEASATQYAADAFLAKVYFSQNKFTDAKIYADKVMAGGFVLNTSKGMIYLSEGLIRSPETIFQIVNLPNDKDNGVLYGRFSVPPFGSTISMYRMNGNLIGLLQNAQLVGDTRYTALFKRTFGRYTCKKYDDQNMNVTIIRFAEILLLRAECEARAGDESGARDDLNKIRAVAGLINDHSSSGQGLINAIWAERDLELAMEGDHYSEFKRRSALMHSGTFHCQDADFAWNAERMIYPIPQQEVDQNKSMTQNPGY